MLGLLNQIVAKLLDIFMQEVSVDQFKSSASWWHELRTKAVLMSHLVE